MNYAIISFTWNATQGKNQYEFTCETEEAIATITEDCAIGSTAIVTNGASVFFYGCKGWCKI